MIFSFVKRTQYLKNIQSVRQDLSHELPTAHVSFKLALLSRINNACETSNKMLLPEDAYDWGSFTDLLCLPCSKAYCIQTDVKTRSLRKQDFISTNSLH